MTKPFSFAEGLARVRALLRSSSQPESSALEVDGISMDMRTRRVRREGREVSLTAREFELLAYLMCHPDQVIGYGETAIAEAARPTLGDAGFTIMALLSTAGATNATLYASGNLTGMLAKTGLVAPIFGEKSPLGRNAGLLITTGVVLIVANVVDLSAIASVGSAVR